MRKTAYVAISLAAAAATVIAFVGCGKRAGVPDPIATVDGVAIPSSRFVKAVMLQGSQILSNQIEEQIILNWAKEESAMPTDDQRNRQVESLKRDGLYDDQVKLLGEDDVKQEVDYTLARANLYKKFGTMDDSEVKRAYEMMKTTTYVRGPRKQFVVLLNWDKARLEEAAKKAGEGQDIDKLAREYSEPVVLQGSSAQRFWEDNVRLPKEVTDAAKSTKNGSISGIIPLVLGPEGNSYVFVKIVKELPKADIPFERVKAEVEDMVAFQKSMSQYDTSSFQDKFKERKKKADIKINSDQLLGALSFVKNPPAPAPPMTAPPPGATRIAPPKPAAKPGK